MELQTKSSRLLSVVSNPHDFSGRIYILLCEYPLGVPESRPLADFLPTITIKAKDFANEITNEITNFNIKRDDLRTEGSIIGEHVQNNTEVRNLLAGRSIVPERLPPSENIKKIERRLESKH